MKYNIYVFTLIILLTTNSFNLFASNGVWHFAKDIKTGVMGTDENDVNSFYSFINPV